MEPKSNHNKNFYYYHTSCNQNLSTSKQCSKKKLTKKTMQEVTTSSYKCTNDENKCVPVLIKDCRIVLEKLHSHVEMNASKQDKKPVKDKKKLAAVSVYEQHKTPDKIAHNFINENTFNDFHSLKFLTKKKLQKALEKEKRKSSRLKKKLKNALLKTKFENAVLRRKLQEALIIKKIEKIHLEKKVLKALLKRERQNKVCSKSCGSNHGCVSTSEPSLNNSESISKQSVSDKSINNTKSGIVYPANFCEIFLCDNNLYAHDKYSIRNDSFFEGKRVLCDEPTAKGLLQCDANTNWPTHDTNSGYNTVFQDSTKNDTELVDSQDSSKHDLITEVDSYFECHTEMCNEPTGKSSLQSDVNGYRATHDSNSSSNTVFQDSTKNDTELVDSQDSSKHDLITEVDSYFECQRELCDKRTEESLLQSDVNSGLATCGSNSGSNIVIQGSAKNDTELFDPQYSTGHDLIRKLDSYFECQKEMCDKPTGESSLQSDANSQRATYGTNLSSNFVLQDSTKNDTVLVDLRHSSDYNKKIRKFESDIKNQRYIYNEQMKETSPQNIVEAIKLHRRTDSLWATEKTLKKKYTKFQGFNNINYFNNFSLKIRRLPDEIYVKHSKNKPLMISNILPLLNDFDDNLIQSQVINNATNQTISNNCENTNVLNDSFFYHNYSSFSKKHKLPSTTK